MTSTIHNPTEDVTGRRRDPGPGLAISFLCSRCNKPKSTTGRKLNKRTRLFECAQCKEK